jgi:flagellar hook-associated protein 3 FlgL
MMQRNVLADLNSVSSRLSKTQSKIASNKEISRPSDDPFDASRAMALRQSLAATRQQQRNAEDAMGWQDATEQSLGQITDLVHRARELVVRGATDSADAADRSSIATELEQIIESVKQNANATYRGSYLFSGSKTDTLPYQQGAVDAYAGDEAGLDPLVPACCARSGPA